MRNSCGVFVELCLLSQTLSPCWLLWGVPVASRKRRPKQQQQHHRQEWMLQICLLATQMEGCPRPWLRAVTVPTRRRPSPTSTRASPPAPSSPAPTHTCGLEASQVGRSNGFIVLARIRKVKITILPSTGCHKCIVEHPSASSVTDIQLSMGCQLYQLSYTATHLTFVTIKNKRNRDHIIVIRGSFSSFLSFLSTCLSSMLTSQYVNRETCWSFNCFSCLYWPWVWHK